MGLTLLYLTYHSRCVARHKVKYGLSIFIPIENVPTITATDDVLAIGTKEIHTFYCFLITKALEQMNKNIKLNNESI